MADRDALSVMARPSRARGVIAALAASLMLGACAQVGGDEGSGLFAALAPESTREAAAAAVPADPRLAAEHWGEKYSKNPRDLDAALGYAQNLTALGRKREALTVLQQAAIVHGSNKRLARDYGRLALDLDQISVAKKLLEIADDPTDPDWRVILARGTVHAKEGSYREAIKFYERAHALEPQHPSVLNNLALAYTMSGEPERGEAMLRQAQAGGGDARVRQNLALVLGLQGKYEEATHIASADLEAADAEANTALLRRMVRRDAQPMAPAMPQTESWAPAVAAAPVAPAPQRPAAPALRPTTMETGFGTATANASPAALFTAE